MRKLFFLLVAFFATTCLWAHNFEVDGIYYNYLDGNNVEVTYKGSYSSYDDNEYSGVVNIPNNITYYGTTYCVTSIGDEAFDGCASLTSITIPNSVTSIGDYAFYDCSKLTSITIPNSLTSIGWGAFYGCTSLTSITIPNSVTNIRGYAFRGCTSLTSITIPESITSIGDEAFRGCASLTSITIPESVTSIGWEAFDGCTSLTSITIPNSVTNIGDYAFYNCTSLTSPVYNAHCFAYMPTSYSGAYTIPEGIKQIAGAAFLNCSSLTSVSIGTGVTSIGRHAFYNCTSLTSVTIGNGVKSIGDYAFYGCASLTSITIPESVTSIGQGAFEYTRIYNINWENDVLYISNCLIKANDYISGSYTIKDNTRLIADYAFNDCSKLTSITIPNSVTSIGDCAFDGCASLTSVTIGNGVKSIGNCAFRGCSKLTSITIPNSVTSIGSDAFYGCSSLTSITIPESVTSIGYDAFRDCSSLISITIPESVTSIGDDAFRDCSSLISITIPESVTSIGDGAFYGCSSLVSIVWNAKNYADFTEAQKASFYSIRSQINSFTFGEKVEHIPAYLCYYMDKLTSIAIPNSVTSIGSDAFYDCSKLTKTNYTGDVASWCNIKFGNSSANPMSNSHNFYINGQEIKDLVIPNTVDSIHDFALYSCIPLTSITIPNSVTSIGDSAFYDCSKLTKTNYTGDVASWCNIKFGNSSANPMSNSHNFYINYQEIKDLVIPNTVDSIHDYAFCSCTSLTSITIPNSVTSIGSSAFESCFSLTSVTIPNSVTSIGNYAFYFCWDITSVTCEATTPPTMNKSAFHNGLNGIIPQYLYVPCGCISAYKAADGWKDFANIQEPLAEYSIDIKSQNNNMGSATVDKNTLCGNQISAIPNYGYHFVQWSDGNLDNPRSLVLIQDTMLTAEFAPNNYTITTRSNYTERGSTLGDTTTTYLNYITISAIPNYGYHFTLWNDGNTDNPRRIQVNQDKTYTAYFDKNIYSITTNCNHTQGSVNSVSTSEYLDNITLTATPHIGYQFIQWSDGQTDNPRDFILTQDTTFTAEFAQAFSGQCGDNLYWSYDENSKAISIFGTGKMYDYTSTTQPWILFKEELKEVAISNTATSLGQSAFAGSIRLAKVEIGANVENIADSTFAGCNRLYHVYCYPTYPPFAEQSSFANYNVYLHVPCEEKEAYELDMIWGNFKNIECIGAESENITTDDVILSPSTDNVTITWPTEDNADTYTIVIKKDNEVFCTLTFNADGLLLNIAFAPARNGNHHAAQYAAQTAKGLRFTVTGLEEATTYAYNITAKDASDKTIKSHSGEFTTQSNTSTDVDNLNHSVESAQKLLRDGQLLIIRNGVEYSVMGQEM